MSRDPKEGPLPARKHEPTTTETVEMTEIDGMGQGAILQFTDVGRRGKPSEEKEVRTCYGDLCVIVNALRDYANLLDNSIQEMGATDPHAAIYELHAARCRKIAGKYAAAIGYDYDKALERCRHQRAKGEQSDDTGLDGMEAFVRKAEFRSKKKKGDEEK